MWPQDEYIDPVFWIVGFGRASGNRFQSRRTCGKVVSQVRVLFKFPSDVLTRMTSFSNGVSSKKVYLKPHQCFQG